MLKILSNTYFQFFVIPLLTTLLAVFVKIVSRNDKFSTVKKEDFAIGLEIAITSILLLVSDTLKFATKINNEVNNGQDLVNNTKLLTVPWILIAFFIGLWGISTIIRKMGWKNGDEMNIWWGIVFPNIFGLLSLIFVVNWINN